MELISQSFFNCISELSISRSIIFLKITLDFLISLYNRLKFTSSSLLFEISLLFGFNAVFSLNFSFLFNFALILIKDKSKQSSS